MAWYTIQFASWPGEDLIDAWDHEPTEKERELESQTVGYLWGGAYEAETPEEAYAMAEAEFDGMG